MVTGSLVTAGGDTEWVGCSLPLALGLVLGEALLEGDDGDHADYLTGPTCLELGTGTGLKGGSCLISGWSHLPWAGYWVRYCRKLDAAVSLTYYG